MRLRFALNFILPAVLLAVQAEPANAYSFMVCSDGWEAVYVHVHTVSAFCHDRTPVSRSDKPLTFGCISGSSAGGCLIDRVDFVLQNGQSYSWSAGIGRAGGRFTLKDYIGENPFVCFDGDRDDC